MGALSGSKGPGRRRPVVGLAFPCQPRRAWERPPYSTAGFTLMEILLAAALMLIVLGLLYVPLMSTFGYFRTGTAQADAQNVTRTALDAMCRELQEAMYVQLDMYDNTVVAFIPPLRVDPNDPNSEIVTPPRPDWDHAIRYWRALHDPTANYNPGTRVGAPNTYYLARTVVEYPLATDDPWNRWNGDWAAGQSANAVDEVPNWAPIPRVVNTDVDIYGTRATIQAGYPYLAVQYGVRSGEMTQAEGVRRYRDLVVGMTPNAVDYDVTSVEFQPLVVSGEWLTPASSGDGDDRSVYHTRYPLLRLGAPYTGWASLSQAPIPVPKWAQTWARYPFVLIYRYQTQGGYYAVAAVGCFDPRSRTMRVIEPVRRGISDEGQRTAEIYDTGGYPYRLAPGVTGSTPIAFGIGLDGWIEGAFRFDFPPPGEAEAMANDSPVHVLGSSLNPATVTVGETTVTVYEWPLMQVWRDREGGDTLTSFLLPDSVQVRVHDYHGLNDEESPERVLTQVYCTPRSGLDEFQVGLDPTARASDGALRYGVIRLPERLADKGKFATEHHYRVDFRWRSNGVWARTAGYPNGQEFPDLMCAYYRSAAVLDVSLTVTRANPGARTVQRVAQSAHLTRRVKLPNALRKISYGSR